MVNLIKGLRFTYKGGEGSGYEDHPGRPGEVGGSLPSKLPLVNNRGEEVRIEKVSKELESIRSNMQQWGSEFRDNISNCIIVGSFARGEEREDSDIDFDFVVKSFSRFLDLNGWGILADLDKALKKIPSFRKIHINAFPKSYIREDAPHINLNRFFGI